MNQSVDRQCGSIGYTSKRRGRAKTSKAGEGTERGKDKGSIMGGVVGYDAVQLGEQSHVEPVPNHNPVQLPYAYGICDVRDTTIQTHPHSPG